MVLKLLTSNRKIRILVQHLNSTSRLPHRLLDQNPMSIKQDSPRLRTLNIEP